MATSSTVPSTTDEKHPHAVISKNHRLLRLVKLFIIAFVSVGTFVLTVIDVFQTVKKHEKEQKLSRKIESSIRTSYVIHNLQKERGLTALFLLLKIWHEKGHVEELHRVRQDTNESILAFRQWDSLGTTLTNRGDPDLLLNLLHIQRAKINGMKENVLVSDHLHIYSSWINELISLLPLYIANDNWESFANVLFTYQLIIQSKEEAGLERALGGLYFIQGKNISVANASWYHEKRIRAKSYLSTAFSFSTEVKKIYEAVIKEVNATPLINHIEERRKLLVFGNISKPSQDSALEWFHLMTQYNNLLLEVQTRHGSYIIDQVKDGIQLTARSLIIRSLLLCFTLVVVPCILISLVKVENELYKYTLTLFDTVGLEQARTEFLMQENSRYVSSECSKVKFVL